MNAERSYSRDFQDDRSVSGIIVVDPPGQKKHPSAKFEFQVDEESPLIAGSHGGHGHSGSSPKDGGCVGRLKNSRFRGLLRLRQHMKAVKVGVVFAVLLLAIVAFAMATEPEVNYIFALDSQAPSLVPLQDHPDSFVELEARLDNVPEFPFDIYIDITLEQQTNNNKDWLAVISEIIIVPAEEHSIQSGGGEGAEIGSTVKLIWELPTAGQAFRLNISTNATHPVPIPLKIILHNSIYRYKELLAALVLSGMYALIVFELVDRTVAAIVGSFLAIATLSLVNARPPLDVIVTWIEYNTLALLFGMMIIVGIFSTTGFFEWIALKAYEFSNGSVWRLVVVLCTFTAVASGLLDNVTSMLLLTPVVLRLCKVVGLSPVPVLISVVTMSNIGGCATAVGDPPMTIIVNTPEIIAADRKSVV